ncbi:hypothetical protein IFM89_035477 [Coptis chinensis]|uniref:Carbohydrate kinase PfkB domain-containing protein n=1 Tax=Coptis chinensis TaxID=261450 RepID=A0A835HDK1_9MAGN|nr:hypothetical protein IFM89_035477 [Coptis chinensis]
MALYSAAFCFDGVVSNRPISITSLSTTTKHPVTTLGLTSRTPRLCRLQGKALPSDNGSPDEYESLVVCFGEMLIDFVPTISGLSLAEAPAFKKAPGGAPANVAVGIARLGGSSAFIGKFHITSDSPDPPSRNGDYEKAFNNKLGMNLMFFQELIVENENRESKTLLIVVCILFVNHTQVGDDEFGYMLADILKENNVNNKGLRFDPGARTALAFVTLRADGEREFMFFRNPSADMLLQESELDLDIITKISKEEISFLTKGEDPYDDAVVRKLFHPDLKLLLVTEGPDGCRYYTKDFNGRVKGLKVDAVDTTGAGDAFVAGILSLIAADLSLLQDEGRLREALRFANACGALTVMERGAIPALPSREAVTNALLKIPV